jgi:CHAD domain-containing protein
MEIERLLPIPFLYWVLPYRVKWNKKDVDLDAAVMKQVERVCGDLRHIDVVRTEWESKLEPLPLDVESLE